MTVPVLKMAPQPDGGPHPELRADGPSPRVQAETGGEPLTVLRTRNAVLGYVTSPDWVMAGITADGELRGCPVLGAERQDKYGGMLNMNPPDHTTFRKPVNRILTRAAGDATRQDAKAVALDLAGRLRGHKSADLAADYADPFAATVVCRSLGLSLGEWPHILAGSENAFSPVHGVPAVEQVDEGWREAYEFYAAARYLAHPDGTVAQISRAFRGLGLAPLTHVLGNVGGGYPAVRQSARRLLREMAGDYRAHADACLRRRMSWSALTGLVLNTRALFPLDVPRRCAAEEGAYLDGQFFAPGELALPSLAAAAADLAWPRPAGDIAFSSGRHRCPGGRLARMWLTVAAEVFFTVHPKARLYGDEGPWEGDTLAAPRWVTVTGLS
jgi:cytochrome P450